MRELRASAGRFASAVGFRNLCFNDPESRYELLVFDRNWTPVVPLNEWYRPAQTARFTSHEADVPRNASSVPGLGPCQTFGSVSSRAQLPERHVSIQNMDTRR